MTAISAARKPDRRGQRNLPTGSAPTLIYGTDTERLWYDADGSGTGDSAVLLATLEGVNQLSLSDFQFV